MSVLPVSSTTDRDSSKAEPGLIDMLLDEQQSLTAVERFSAAHDAAIELDSPAQSKYYQELLPASAPAPGQQFAFRVDLDACSGCKACVVACHTLNGLEEDESWRRVGTITVGQDTQSRLQHVTTACHHCADPGCLNGCPVKAYDKDEVTGIVRHLDDQCIGCKYCTMMCPYEVPRFSERLGIVRKCDMCHQRLSAGEAPACVQSCPNSAIAIQIVQENRSHDGQRLAPGAPVSSITRPTTCYVSDHRAAIEAGSPQDVGVDEVAENHWPLAAMLVATQASVGLLVTERMAAAAMWMIGSQMPMNVTQMSALVALVIALLGMAVAPLHLGQPLRAWRVFLGLRTSWLSREAVLLGKFVGLLAASLGLMWMPAVADHLPEALVAQIPAWAAKATLGLAILFGIAGLYSSAMIYVATKRQLWRPARTLPKFFATAVGCGSAAAAIVILMADRSNVVALSVLFLSLLVVSLKVAWEWQWLTGHRTSDDDYDRRSRRLVRDQLESLSTLRFTLGISAIALLAIPLVAAMATTATWILYPAVAALVLLLASEVCERLLYFSSVVYDRMPGTLR